VDKKLSIQVRNVSKTFGQGDDQVHALKNVSLDVYEGELMMIVGPSGCGKTTLLSTIAGTLHFDAGTIRVLDYELETLNKDKLAEFRSVNIGFIFQQYHLIPTLTCVENSSIPLIIQGKSRNLAFESAKNILEKVGLGDKYNKLPRQLSGGQQQRVAVARALIHEPPIVICDEPTSALDFETGTKVMELLKHIAQTHNRSVIVVTHDHRIYKYADRVIEMDDGAVQSVTNNNGDYDHA
jgi:putative ABC transport system ATP-binding protein